MTPQHHLPADIERTSISIITRELDELGLTPPPETAAVVKRVIHTTADFDYAKNLRFTPGAVEAAVKALHAGAFIVTDTNMALAGITKPGLKKLNGEAICYMADPAVAEAAKQAGTTRAVAAMHRAAREHPGAILAIGNAPTALLTIAEEMEAGLWRAGRVCECGGKQGSAVCRLRAIRRACHRRHGPQGRQQCGCSHLQRPHLLCRRNAGPLCQRVERIRWKQHNIKNPEPFLSRFGREKVPGFVHDFFRELFCNSLIFTEKVRTEHGIHTVGIRPRGTPCSTLRSP